MRAEIFRGNTEELRHIARCWADETKDNAFGIEINVDSHLADLQGFVDGFGTDILVLSDVSGPVGYMGLQVFKSPLGSQKIANEHYWYVMPDKRGIGSIELVKLAFRWTKDSGCSHLIFNASNLAGDVHDKVCKFYERLKMQKFETSYIMAIGA